MLAKNTRKIGDYGEDIASIFLEKKGYKVVNRNIYFSNQEVDIIAIVGEKHYIIEVKTSSQNSVAEPEDYMNQRKLVNLKKAGRAFSRRHRISMENIYFDLIAIKLDRVNNRATIKHYKNIC